MFFSRTFQIINLCVIAFCNIKYAKAHLPIFYCILYIIIIFYFRIKLIKKVGFWPQSMFFVKNKPKSTVFKPFLPYFKPFLVIFRGQKFFKKWAFARFFCPFFKNIYTIFISGQKLLGFCPFFQNKNDHKIDTSLPVLTSSYQFLPVLIKYPTY